jgi:Zn-finger nucleic acid-binding protein
MKCPTCIDSTLVMSERSGIEIDYCPTCRGVWLDRGELDKIIEKSLSQKPEVEKSPRVQIQEVIYRDGHLHSKDHDYKYKKKKSFLEELFD